MLGPVMASRTCGKTTHVEPSLTTDTYSGPPLPERPAWQGYHAPATSKPAKMRSQASPPRHQQVSPHASGSSPDECRDCRATLFRAAPLHQPHRAAGYNHQPTTPASCVQGTSSLARARVPSQHCCSSRGDKCRLPLRRRCDQPALQGNGWAPTANSPGLRNSPPRGQPAM